jgi:spermidine synthase
MNLTNEKYDIIILDAFMDLLGETCAPEPFRTERFVRKVISHLNSDGVLMVNTLPSYCSKYEFERNLYHDFFGRLYIGSFYGNTLLMGQMGNGTTKRQIESRIEYYEEMFARVDADIYWIAESFNDFKKYKRNSLYNNYCDLFTYTFMDNVCSI